MRSETFDNLHIAIYNVEEALADNTISSSEESELRQALMILEELIDED